MATSAVCVAMPCLLLAGPLLAQTPTLLVPPGPSGGGQTNAHFGYRVAGVRSVDPLGRGDALVGAPDENMPGGFNDCGRVYIYSGFNGELLRTINPLNKQPGGLFGFALAGLDNINGDALGDFIVGAPLQHPGATPNAAGRAYVIRGDTGTMIRAHKSPLEQAGSLYGYSVAAVGDLNADGRTEYLVSAPWETVGRGAGARDGAGRVYLYNGASGALLKIFWSPAYEEDGHFGFAMAGVPDLSGDGRPEILIGAPNDDPGASPTDCGRAYLFSGAAPYPLLRVMASPYQEAGGEYGFSVSGIPNVDGDTRGDIIVGAPGDSPGNSPFNCGRAYMYSGATGHYLRTLASPNQVGGGRFGLTVVGALDSTGDIYGDVYVAAPYEAANLQAQGGHVYVFDGHTGELVRDITSPNNQIQGLFGFGMASIPTPTFVNSPGVLIGGPRESPGKTPSQSGRAYVYPN